MIPVEHLDPTVFPFWSTPADGIVIPVNSSATGKPTALQEMLESAYRQPYIAAYLAIYRSAVDSEKVGLFEPTDGLAAGKRIWLLPVLYGTTPVSWEKMNIMLQRVGTVAKVLDVSTIAIPRLSWAYTWDTQENLIIWALARDKSSPRLLLYPPDDRTAPTVSAPDWMIEYKKRKELVIA